MGRTVVAWAGVVGGGALGGNARWWRQVPKDGGEQNWHYRAGAGCAPGRGGSFGSGCAWWLRVLVGALLPLGARGGAGGWRFPLGGGLGWW